ncbi:transcription factor HHO5-like isoform X2 [Prosopis cineraria]|uniref:transcription factor HHO5-like isoform X2 n=1 Tax=Prosopis cineraria TaxID=364024 RepID=UPI00240FBE2E|nr:transcription factor HHO5-like isoform X2 [Prosopis cineraria]
MGSVPPELSLDLRPTFVPKTISDFLYEVSSIGNAADKLSRFDEFLKRLEEEMKKIDAFKRELPLCMLLLNDAILTLKEESAKLRMPTSRPVLEEFIPLTRECDQKKDNKKENGCRDKKNWMSSVQLWNTSIHPATNHAYEQRQHYELENKKCEEEGQSVPEVPFQSGRNGDNGCRAFFPFSAYPSNPATPVATREEKEDSINGLSLLTPGTKNLKEGSGSSGSGSSSSRAVSSSTPSSQPIIPTGHLQPQKQVARKQRRCWSPELHRRFVNALQQLGGSLAATPKQIRELMQVDSLTNDEVKSHLQKYRLHTRRTPATTAAPANQSVVLGGLWMSQDQHNESSKASSSGSGSPQGPLQLAGSGGGMSRTEGDSMEDDEEEKSESFSWKSHIHKPRKDV